jgi:hypothetical protein
MGIPTDGAVDGADAEERVDPFRIHVGVCQNLYPQSEEVDVSIEAVTGHEDIEFAERIGKAALVPEGLHTLHGSIDVWRHAR